MLSALMLGACLFIFLQLLKIVKKINSYVNLDSYLRHMIIYICVCDYILFVVFLV